MFDELWHAAIALADLIDRRGPGRKPVAILLSGDRYYLVAMLACLAARRVALLLDASFPEVRSLSMIAAAGASLVLKRDGPRTNWPALEYLDPTPCVDHACTLSANVPSGSALRVELDEPALLLATSGSTGTPKLIAHSQRTLWHWARTAHDSMRVTPDDRALSLSSASSLGGVTALFGIPLAGASLHLFDIKTSGISGLLRVLSREPITILRGAPSLFRALAALEQTRGALAGLRILQTYGEPLLRADVLELRKVLPTGCFIRTSYGATECSGLEWYADMTEDHDEFRVAAGVLMPDTEALVDDGGRCCGPGEVGELVIRSRYNALGEWQDGRVISARLAPDRTDPSLRIYRTGDLARYTEDDVFIVLGRQDRMVKINGQRVEPAEIETILRANTSVADLEIVATLRDGRTLLVACLVAEPGESVGLANAARAQLSAALPAFMVPRVLILDRLPRLPGGKVDLTALGALVEQR